MFRKDKTQSKPTFTDATEYYQEIRSGFREKSDHNKIESQLMFLVIISFTLLAPMFVTMGPGWFWGKLLPSLLSVGAAGATAWVQIRKPQRLWSIYRRAQRELEREKTAYDFRLNDFAENPDRDKLLVSKVSDIAFRVHEQWEGLVPEPDMLPSRIPSAVSEAENK